MSRWLVTWEVDVEADDPKAAARAALHLQDHGRGSIANVFTVARYDDGEPDRYWVVDLWTNQSREVDIGTIDQNARGPEE